MGAYWLSLLPHSDLEIGDSNESGDLGFSKWIQSILGKPGLLSFFKKKFLF